MSSLNVYLVFMDGCLVLMSTYLLLEDYLIYEVLMIIYLVYPVSMTI